MHSCSVREASGSSTMQCVSDSKVSSILVSTSSKVELSSSWISSVYLASDRLELVVLSDSGSCSEYSKLSLHSELSSLLASKYEIGYSAGARGTVVPVPLTLILG